MSNFNDVLSEASKQRDADQADSRRKKAGALLDDLDKMPNQSSTSASSASAPTSAVPAAKGVTPIRDEGPSNAGQTSTAAGSGLMRADSSNTPLHDAGLIEEGGIAMSMCGFGNGSDPVGTQLFAMAGLHPPSERSFEEFFRDWFAQKHFPVMSEEVKRELVHRARNKGFFSGLSSQVKKWAMANTDARLQSDVWHAYFIQNAPPSYAVYGCMRVAFMNLGSVARPCWVRFYGMPAGPDSKDQADQWVLMPWASHDPEIPALLDELDGRGGMTALLSAAS